MPFTRKFQQPNNAKVLRQTPTPYPTRVDQTLLDRIEALEDDNTELKARVAALEADDA